MSTLDMDQLVPALLSKLMAVMQADAGAMLLAQGDELVLRRVVQPSGRSRAYINGRLWDTRDRGSDDMQFSGMALPAATKDEHGKPVVESYGSKEADGSDVRLAVMCPTTELWQAKVRDIVSRLFTDVGVKGVYIDQVAAAADSSPAVRPGGPKPRRLLHQPSRPRQMLACPCQRVRSGGGQVT